MEINETSSGVSVRFDSYTEAIESAIAHGKHAVGVSYGSPSWNNAVRIAREGWPEGTGKFKAIADGLNVSSVVFKPEITYDVVGNCGIDMGRAVVGEPECMMEWQDTDVESSTHNGPIVRMLVNRASSSGIGSSAIESKGSCIVALIDALESAGKRVELETVDYCTNYDRQYCAIYIPVKRAEDALQIDQLAFAVAHPDYERKMAFSLICQAGKIGAEFKRQHWYGIPQDVPNPFEYDIYIPTMYLGNDEGVNWRDSDSAIQWARRMLEQLGIKLNDEGENS